MPYGLYRASMPVQGCTLLFYLYKHSSIGVYGAMLKVMENMKILAHREGNLGLSIAENFFIPDEIDRFKQGISFLDSTP